VKRRSDDAYEATSDGTVQRMIVVIQKAEEEKEK
jgi:hypothetical protein